MKKYYYVNIKGEDNLVFHTNSWDSVFCFLIDYYNGYNNDKNKRIIKNIIELKDKIYAFELFTELEIDFISILDNPLLMDSVDVRNLDLVGNEIE
jgi:hypothetical protein